MAPENAREHNNPWEKIGFFKPVAGFWYDLFFVLINLLLGIIISGVFLSYLVPFPESIGYRSAIMGLFTFMFRLFDLGTHMVIDRYIAETRIKDVNRMVKLIQYFIWYQMCTGLIQTTAISLYALFIVPKTELAYGIWLMLIAASLQYPGFLGVFHGVIQSLQHYNKSAILNFVHGEVIQRITEIGFVLLGKWYGENNPQIGMIMGIAIGAAIGTYIDDFIAMVFGAYFFKQIMHSQGIPLKRCFMIEFRWADIKDPFLFGLKTGLPGLLGSFTGFLTLWISLQYISQYTSFNALVSMAGTFTWVLGVAVPQMTPLFSESYLNGKRALAESYVIQTFRFIYLIAGALISIFMLIRLILQEVMLAWNLDNYLLIIPFIVPLIIKTLIEYPNRLGDQIIIGTDKPNLLITVRVIEDCVKIISILVIIVWLQVPNRFGFFGLLIALVFIDVPAIIVKTTLVFVYLHRNVLKIRLSVPQTFVAPFLSSLCIFGLGVLAKYWIFDRLESTHGVGVALIVFGGLILVIGLLIYFPLTLFFGGWDAESMNTFEKAVEMSGPSKFIAKPIYYLNSIAAKISPLHNRFAIDTSVANREAQELYEMKLNSMKNQ